mmetsp:Transcript_22540/g.33793  ORF Transcript_22540/g.33793 Transcript_22540/m.33793 type:complete len:383 (-) Transcript_22540:631-1779(-)
MTTDIKGVPALYQYAITQQWDALIDRARSHPEETKWYEPTSRTTTLHVLCQSITNTVSPPPFRAVSILARTHAACNAPFQVKNGDWTPLHYACSRKANAEVIRLLVDEAKSVHVPICALKDHAACCALHIACRSGSTVDVIEILAEEYPEAVWMRSEMGKVNPFESLWQAECHNVRINSRINNGRGKEKLGGQDPFEIVCNQHWDKFYILLRAAYEHLHGESESSIPILHAICEKSMCIPRNFLLFAIKKFGTDEATVKDDMGRIPLVALLDSACSHRRAVDELLRIHAAGAGVPYNDKLPLMIAIENGIGLKDGLSSLVFAAPFALTSRDKETCLYPFMLAATKENPSLSTTFELLRQCPEPIQTSCNFEGGENDPLYETK